MSETDDFLAAFRGAFANMLRWHEFEALWQVLHRQAGKGWYIYHVSEPAPDAPADASMVTAFLSELEARLRREHEEDYCGIVYVDDPADPRFVKIYDPSKLGTACGTGGTPPLPGWILSTRRPVDLPATLSPSGGRRRWWRHILRSRALP